MDYNIILSDEMKIEVLKKMIEEEKEKIRILLFPDNNDAQRIDILEAYYEALAQVNAKFGAKAVEDNQAE